VHPFLDGMNDAKDDDLFYLLTRGHHAVIFALALGSEASAFTSSEYNVENIIKLCIHHVIIVKGDFGKDFTLGPQVILSMRKVAEGFPLIAYMRSVFLSSCYRKETDNDNNTMSLSVC
jgi:hypothetical protein